MPNSLDLQHVEYILGLDLGQAADYSAIAICERGRRATGELDGDLHPKFSPPVYHFRYLERLKLGTPYPEQVRHVKALVEQPPLCGQVSICLDYTGVGRPTYDLFKESGFSCPVFGVSIHGGNTVSWHGPLASVPKRDLVAVIQVLLQSERLKIAEGLPDTQTLTRELLNFRMKIDPVTAHDSYAAWREGQHDDLVLATALACWIAEKRRRAGTWGR